jgi:hypothetical protein
LLAADLSKHFNYRVEICVRDSAQRFTEAGLSARDWYASIGADIAPRASRKKERIARRLRFPN